jgi:formyltetrahydrofolate synthetase
MKKIQEVAANIGITEEQLIPYGHYKAKITCTLMVIFMRLLVLTIL